MKANCTICCDLFDDAVSVAATSCGHTFHEICLLQWVEHSRTCPTCRKHVSHKNVIRLFFNVAPDQHLNIDRVQNELDGLKAELKLKQLEQYKMKTDMDELRSLVVKAELQFQDAKDQLGDARSEISVLKMNVKTLTKELFSMKKVNGENLKLKDQLQHLKNAEMIISGCEKDIKDILEQYSDSPAAKRQMATYCALLKMELKKAGDGKRKLQDELKCAKKELGYKTTVANDTQERMKQAEAEIKFLKECLDNSSSDDTLMSPSSSTYKRKIPETSINSSDVESHLFQLPVKRPKVNILSPTQCKLSDNIISRSLTVGSSFFKPQSKCNDSSVVSVGYDGMGGHGKHVIRSTKLRPPLKTRKHILKKENFNNTIHDFLSNHPT